MGNNKVQVINCTICDEAYDLEDKEPVALPACGHTFCRLCLVRMKRENAELRCPTCRAAHRGDHPLDLPRNFALLSCIEDQLNMSREDTSPTLDRNSEEDLEKERSFNKNSEEDSKKKDRNEDPEEDPKKEEDTKKNSEEDPKKEDTNKNSKEDPKKEEDRNEDPEEDPKKGGSNYLKIGACVALGAVGTVVVAPVVLAGVGFTSGGIAAGSYAASMMSSAAIANGGGVAAASLVAALQSASAAGIGIGRWGSRGGRGSSS
nr:polycomb group RING finger protein 3-like [Penaeus vannamei]